MGRECTGEMSRVINSPWVDHDFSALALKICVPGTP